MIKITIKQVRLLLKLNREVFLVIGSNLYQIYKSDFEGYAIDHKTIKEVILQHLNTNANKWSYCTFAGNKGLLNIVN